MIEGNGTSALLRPTDKFGMSQFKFVKRPGMTSLTLGIGQLGKTALSMVLAMAGAAGDFMLVPAKQFCRDITLHRLDQMTCFLRQSFWIFVVRLGGKPRQPVTFDGNPYTVETESCRRPSDR